MLLADAAQAVGGKLYVLGGGWSVMGPGPTRMAVAIKFEIPWAACDVDHEWRLDLIDGDGRPVGCIDHDGAHTVRQSGRFRVTRPDGVPPGTPVDLAVAVDCGKITVPPAGRYEWRLTVDGETSADWHASFTSRPATPAE